MSMLCCLNLNTNIFPRNNWALDRLRATNEILSHQHQLYIHNLHAFVSEPPSLDALWSAGRTLDVCPRPS